MARRTPTIPVREVMTAAPRTVFPDTSVGELLTLFERHDFNAFPVVNASGELCGIVTKLDLLRLLGPDERLQLPDLRVAASRRVASLMRHGVVTIEGDEPVAVTAHLMVETGLRSLPVVYRRGRGPELVGIVSRGDLLRGLNRELLEAAQAPVVGERSVP
ncbi:MAG TPA: CBS domain-containing protein [Gemmatimonadales bacterium]